MEKIIGIIGGMGPESTVDLFEKLVHLDVSNTDQEHVRVIIDCNTKIPDRNEAYFGIGPSPLPGLIESARILQEAGCGLIIIACNSAHLWYDEITHAVNIPVLNIMKASLWLLKNTITDVKVVGLMGSEAMYASNIYHKVYETANIKILSPSPEEIKELMSFIRCVKRGDKSEDICKKCNTIANNLAERDAETIIAGCTEVPILLNGCKLQVPIIDASYALAKQAVYFAKNKYKDVL